MTVKTIIERYVAGELNADGAVAEILGAIKRTPNKQPTTDEEIWAEAEDRQRFQPGTWGEVDRAWARGIITDQQSRSLGRALDRAVGHDKDRAARQRKAFAK